MSASPAAETSRVELAGIALLNDVHGFLCRFVAFPSEAAAIAATLWAAHAHAMDCWVSTPRIAFLSPEPGSGKTRALEMMGTLVPNPVHAVNVSTAYLFRKVGDQEHRPTILFDEADTVFGPKARGNEDTRALLNAGHRRGAVAGRCVVKKDKSIETEEIPAYSAVAIAGLGDLPDTILARSVIVKMKRRAPGEKVEPYRPRKNEHEGHALRDRLADWASANTPALTDAEPELPDGIEDRDADVWEPLIAIADAAGGEWPCRARKAATSLVGAAHDDTPSLPVRLLGDIRVAFAGAEQVPTAVLLKRLTEMDDAPWGDLHGKPLDARRLSGMLRPYGAIPSTIRTATGTLKGYRREALHDAWARYLPSLDGSSVTSVTSGTSSAAPREDVPDATAVTFTPTELTEALGGDPSSPFYVLDKAEGWIGKSPTELMDEFARRRGNRH